MKIKNAANMAVIATDPEGERFIIATFSDYQDAAHFVEMLMEEDSDEEAISYTYVIQYIAEPDMPQTITVTGRVITTFE